VRRVRYSVAMSLDGFIAGPNGEHDWIIMDPAIDFAALFEPFDTVLVGRRTFEFARRHGLEGTMPRMRAYVFSRTLPAEEIPDVTFVAEDAAATVSGLRGEDGKDIWLMGGGVLFLSLLEKGLVYEVETAIIPVLLGQGVPLLPPPAPRVRLSLIGTRTYPSGIVTHTYSIGRDVG
jgi:dihydrofolate reductase